MTEPCAKSSFVGVHVYEVKTKAKKVGMTTQKFISDISCKPCRAPPPPETFDKLVAQSEYEVLIGEE